MTMLSELDRELISLLRADGRMAVSELARRLGVARATITSRMDRLVASGVIVGFSVRVRDESEVDAIRAMTLIEVEGRSTDAVIRRLRGFPQIVALHTTSGGWDLVAELQMSSLAELDRVLGGIRAIDGVINSETSLLLSSVVR